MGEQDFTKYMKMSSNDNINIIVPLSTEAYTFYK